MGAIVIVFGMAQPGIEPIKSPFQQLGDDQREEGSAARLFRSDAFGKILNCFMSQSYTAG